LDAFYKGVQLWLNVRQRQTNKNIKKDKTLFFFSFLLSWLILIFLLQYCEILKYY